MSHRIALLGTGTEVGKTHVGEALGHVLVARGEHVAALKPVETGAGRGMSDALRLARASMFHVKHACYEFPEPVSPHRAARLQGAAIDLDHICAWMSRHDAPWQLIETAGGLLSPLSAEHTNLDLVVRLQPSAAVLVASDRLGVLHDVSACIVALRALAPELLVRLHVALSAPAAPDLSTGTNGAELQRLAIAERVHVFPWCEPSSEPAQRAAQALVDGIATHAQRTSSAQ